MLYQVRDRCLSPIDHPIPVRHGPHLFITMFLPWNFFVYLPHRLMPMDHRTVSYSTPDNNGKRNCCCVHVMYNVGS